MPSQGPPEPHRSTPATMPGALHMNRMNHRSAFNFAQFGADTRLMTLGSTILASALAATGTDRTTVVALIAIGALASIGAGLGIFAAIRSRRTRYFAQLALCDDLTGVGNRRRLDRDLAMEA